MFESTKSRQVNPELAEIMPAEAIAAVWEKFDQMLTYQFIKEPIVEVWFADALADGNLALNFVQETAGSQEIEAVYDGDDSFLGKALMVEIVDRDDAIFMTFAEKLVAYLGSMDVPEGVTEANWEAMTPGQRYAEFVKINFS